MEKMKNRLGIFGTAAIGLLLAGCLVSGTFVVAHKILVTAWEDIYFYAVDLTEESEWEDHKDDIDNVDAVGFELYIANNNSSDVTFNAFVDDFGETVYTTFSELEDSAILILDNLSLAPGVKTHVSYAKSFDYLKNVGELKRLAKEGKFHFYGAVAGGDVSNIVVDTTNSKIIVTFSASGT